ncbi:hypothetical protein GCM10012275_43140 [Longimycelium tulufanense]|uniref:DUF3558 domain-containing protein n=1 Tax=Longimycelium tulufanense TaxID=907463 RepID=A0A8J3CIS3_9PSEU|nr:hypothetical protein [Longimycelium tulufanense]GGM67944.1 hypothetical protein GCM10012275_43140 [Longimycelium tulufanense]
MRGFGGVWGLVAVVAVLVVAGCGRTTPGTPLPEGSPEPPGGQRAEAEHSVVGNLRTFDPCALVPQEKLAEHGSLDVRLGTQFTQCWVTLNAADPGSIRVMVDVYPVVTLEGAPIQEWQQRGKARVVQKGTPQRCEAVAVWEADKLALQVHTEPVSRTATPGQDTLCQLTETVFDHALTTLQGTESARLAQLRFPDNSLIPVDPCPLLSESDLQALPGIDTTKKRSLPTRHQCLWGSGNGKDPSVFLTFFPGPGAGGDQEATVGGRLTRMESFPANEKLAASCWVTTEHRRITDDTWELARISVYSNDKPERLCEIGTQLAGVAWPKLPPR